MAPQAPAKRRWHVLVSLISGLDVFFVGLHCSLPELERREVRQDLLTVHSVTSYDLELNSENPLDENVQFVIRAWKERKRPSALDRMIDEKIETYKL